MKFHVLRYFVVLAEELHFGRAAQRLAITQPPLSSAIKALEEELEVLLFQRTKTSVQLTPAGTVFLNEARKLLEGAARAKSIVKSVDQGMSGRLDIGFGGTLLFRDVLTIVDTFTREWPGIEVVLREMQSAEQFEWLRLGRLDAGFCHGSTAPPKLRFMPLKDDQLVLCLSNEHPMARHQLIDLKELANESFVMFERDINPANHDTVISLFSRAGIYPRIVHYTRNWMTTMSMVSEGCGMAIVPSTLGRMRMAGVSLVPFAKFREPALGMLAWNPVLTNPALTKFLESAERTMKNIVTG
ncbi:LysR family transcriptional regulator [Advenella mimigardefordensis]|uniref:Transcriptional regulator, LysR family n=1 Tax=Advenella mimigardefordensis (strain DSM 17166 / LMG 22922 / DPN7) TaxID=1247726 RepID=W0PEY9_ADVMD|nr:LysR family transcriptional regulator [Advenella mimigardefordensis]AHG64112.1 transcriptional regulator, LysR family [Advenella mimigardefordensis DPN7]